MDNRYFLMWKNEIITLVSFDNSGNMTAFSKNMPESAKDIVPLAYQSKPDWLKAWWSQRAVPVTRDQIQNLLAKNNIATPDEYLVKNLGLSLTDSYWVKPVDSSLTWEAVNLYDNDFHDDIFLSAKPAKSDGVKQYTPNASLQGNIEKTWTISDKKRYLVKGNRSGTSSESINEVIASEIHKRQGYDNYTPYSLHHIKNKPYQYGCISEAFTSKDKELLSAWDVITSKPMDKSLSYYEHFIKTCAEHGMDKDRLRKDLEYQILSDFVITNYDRHLGNIGILRDSNTLSFIQMAPIFDSGDSLFANRPLPENVKELSKMEINSFVNSESKLLKYVTDRSILDVNKLPSPEFIKEMYHRDEKISDKHIDKLAQWYRVKIDMLDAWQHGKDLYSVTKYISQNSIIKGT